MLSSATAQFTHFLHHVMINYIWFSHKSSNHHTRNYKTNMFSLFSFFNIKEKKSVRKQMVALHSSLALRCIRDKKNTMYIIFQYVVEINLHQNEWHIWTQKETYTQRSFVCCSNEKSIKKKMSFCVVTCNSDDRLSILVKKEHMTEYDTSMAGMAYVC